MALAVYYLRHAESTANIGPYTRNAALTEYGKLQAASVTGSFTYVISSPLRRARDTLRLSRINYKELFVTHKLREMGDGLIPAHIYIETLPVFKKRIVDFEKDLREFVKTCDSCATILIVGHGGFYAHWLSKDPDIHNAEIVEIPRRLYS